MLSLTPYSRVLPEKLTDPQLLKKLPHFMQPKRSLPNSQKPATCPYPEPDRYSPCPLPTSRRCILILPSHPCLRIPSRLLPSGFSTKPYKHLSSLPYVLHALLISAFLTWSPERYLARRIEHKAPRYVVFSAPLDATMCNKTDLHDICGNGTAKNSNSYCVLGTWKNNVPSRVRVEVSRPSRIFGNRLPGQKT